MRGIDIISKVEISCPTERYGTAYGGWIICPLGINRNSVVYSLGVGDDISFDLGLIEKYGVKVHAFDPTPQVASLWSGRQLPEEFYFHPYGIDNFSGEVCFQPPAKKKGDRIPCYSMLAKEPVNSESVKVPMKTLKEAMKGLGHERIDILKMDIEGSEWTVLPDIVKSRLEIYQILVEFHHLKFRNVGIGATKNCINDMAAGGYKIFALSSSGQEYSFIRADLLMKAMQR
jgi:FkbM family methyltransferase